jgi:hypothetical protein
LNEQSKRNEELELEIVELKRQSEVELNEQLKKNEEIELEIDELKRQSQVQSRDNEKLLVEINHLKDQSQLYSQTLTIQLKNINDQFTNQLNKQTEKNAELIAAIDQLKKQSELQATGQSKINKTVELKIDELRTLINKLQADDQNQNTQLVETNQRHDRPEINIKSVRDNIKCFTSE